MALAVWSALAPTRSSLHTVRLDFHFSSWWFRLAGKSHQLRRESLVARRLDRAKHGFLESLVVLLDRAGSRTLRHGVGVVRQRCKLMGAARNTRDLHRRFASILALGLEAPLAARRARAGKGLARTDYASRFTTPMSFGKSDISLQGLRQRTSRTLCGRGDGSCGQFGDHARRQANSATTRLVIRPCRQPRSRLPEHVYEASLLHPSPSPPPHLCLWCRVAFDLRPPDYHLTTLRTT